MKGTIPTIDMIGTGKRITQLRAAAGLSVKDLQGMSYSFPSFISHNIIRIFNTEHVA